MTKSRTPRLAFLAALAAPASAFAQAATPEEAIARQQEQVSELVSQICPPGTAPSDVVVCGRREAASRYRVPFADPYTGGASETAGGEQLRAMNTGRGGCTTVGPMPNCGGGLDVLAIGFTVVRLVRQALANRD